MVVRKLASLLRANPAVGRWALRCLPDWDWTVHVEPVGPFRIRIRRHRSYWLHGPLRQDQFFFGAVERLLRPGDVAYDVGANIGLYVRFLIQHFGAGRVVAFEPMADTFRLLERNVALSPAVAARTTLYNVALADAESEEKFQVDDMSSASSTLDRVTGGAASAGRRQYGMRPRVETVKVMPLDLVLLRDGCPPPALVKLDVEGAAGLALAGMRQTLERHHPDLIVETHGPAEARAALQALRAAGYHCFGHATRDGTPGYVELDESDAKAVADFWQPHHFVASTDVAKVRDEIQPHHCWIGRPDGPAGPPHGGPPPAKP